MNDAGWGDHIVSFCWCSLEAWVQDPFVPLPSRCVHPFPDQPTGDKEAERMDLKPLVGEDRVGSGDWGIAWARLLIHHAFFSDVVFLPVKWVAWGRNHLRVHQI